MDKITFLNELEYQLNKLPKHVVDDVMNTYENYFYEEGKKGFTDKEIVDSLDTPKQIAKRKYAKSAVKDAENKPNMSRIARAIFATVGMSLVTFCFILIPLIFIVIFMLMITFVALGMILSPLILFVSNIWAGLHNFSISNYLFSFAYLGLGTMFLVMIVKASIGIRTLLIRYLKWNMNFIKKGTM
ncbi:MULTISPECIES: DUF1700 domain-containing protein [unclassified Staphylococcus]|uniref:DUF1700 domain-containing protein n=1 Tax=unclassified Staphylococcus TaxID=91994 RepID=UPI0021CE7FB3|nr:MULTISPECIES: DUF1700 domain-containing protein [unclassified Staphylococcus]UXR71095.1 DUF1700 domain-containing protein [Staphylococcus sp. IVB6240]UXR73390.1 DUF1700 domain-containing protein [Staphylococcus sp. IVB6238]UXR75685.1 DUF1700 domain-containing protein [Staphylococcus sp. IVB6233]UXR79883.1 DUF1700 domain-containing protein [Staphylococcus sp. IVB6218]